MKGQKEKEDDNKNIIKIDKQSSDFEVIEEKIGLETDNIQNHKYYRGKILGYGDYSKYYEYNNDNKKIFVGKVIEKNSYDKQRLINELIIHKSLRHPQIVSFENFFENKNYVCFLFEFCENQTLNELLKRRERLTEIEVQCYIVQLINALKYLYNQGIIHCNLNLGNLFLTDKMELKVGDFCFAKKLDSLRKVKRTICGNPNYISPEILDDHKEISYKADIWSLGIIIYTLIIGKPPFEDTDMNIAYKRIKWNSISFPETAIISEAAKNLIAQILVIDPTKRPTLSQILNHDFFNLGTSIPKLLPISTLDCTPSLSYIRSFMPDADKNGIVNRTSPKIKSDDLNQFFNSRLNIQIQPFTSVRKWVDYSSKYGLGYLLTNGFFGVHFNDCTKIILNPTTKTFYYIEKQILEEEVFKFHSMDNYPKDIHDKVCLLQHFKKYLEGENINNTNHDIKDEKEESNKDNNNKKEEVKGELKEKPFNYVKQWMRTRQSIFFNLSNKTIQVCFKDHTEIILPSEKEYLIYINNKGERSCYHLFEVLYNSNNEIAKRLKYIRDILTYLIKKDFQNSNSK